MNRLQERISQCESICCHNTQFVPELYGLLDAQSGQRGMRNRLKGLAEYHRYDKGHEDGLLLKSLDEVTHGHDQSQSHPRVCDAEVSGC